MIQNQVMGINSILQFKQIIFMKLIIRLLLTLLLPLVIIYFYKYIACIYKDTDTMFRIICRSAWVEALILYSAFNIFNLATIIFNFSTSIFMRWIGSVTIYIVVYGIIAFPYMIVSFFNFKFSGFIHFLPILFLIDYFTDNLIRKKQ